MSILTNEIRHGNFSSSNIYRLLGINSTKALERKKALTYIEECNIERDMEISLGVESEARPLQWGKHCEDFAFNQVSTAYQITSDVTIAHPTYDFWVGSPDGVTDDAVIDFKCPMTKKSFYKLVAGDNIYAMRSGFTRMGFDFSDHPDGDKYYWQLLSNAILTGKKYAELIVYMPYQSELVGIKEAAKDTYNWIHYAADIELPFIKDNGRFKNINIIRFEVPQKDIDLLTECVVEASKLLIPRPPSDILFTPQNDGIVLAEKL